MPLPPRAARGRMEANWHDSSNRRKTSIDFVSRQHGQKPCSSLSLSCTLSPNAGIPRRAVKPSVFV